jgi:hypothetical protein
MRFKLNDPVWVLGTVEGYFENYLDNHHPETGMRIGVVANGAGFGAVVPSHWVTERGTNG